jgi:glycosyltransferase involved in cell wall biosynthesis
MNHKSICVHTLVKNDERWIWYAVSSIVDHVDKILIWDTGSTDKTLEIVRKLKEENPDKIFFKEVKNVDPHEFSLFRQKMLDASICDWVIVLDSDEIWPEDAIRELIQTINDNKADVIVAPFINFIGDVFHYQDKSAGRYKIDDRVGNYTIKAFRRKIPGLRVANDYGSEGYIDGSKQFLQSSSKVKRQFLNKHFYHATHLIRSSSDVGVMGREGKVKHEIGENFPLDFYYPEVFFRERPKVVESPWKVMDARFKFRAFFETPLRKIKRRLWWGKAGY